MKTLNKFLIFALLAVVFASCSKDDEKDYTLKDITPLIGEYTGTCVIVPQSIANKDSISESTNVAFIVSATNPKALLLQTDEFGLILKDLLTNFKTSKDGKTYTFNAGAFTKPGSAGAAIPNYIQEWVGDRYKEITKVDLTFKATSGKFTIQSETINFVYEASAKVTGVLPTGKSQTDTYDQILFKYTAIQN